MIIDTSINLCRDVANASTIFEITNTKEKKQYLIKNIILYNSIVKTVNGNCGTFGTGYPFYVLGQNFNGKLPVINEQIRYNKELLYAVDCSKLKNWQCSSCLEKNNEFMPDLKQICKTCIDMDDNLKPRKVINRLPDIDMWLVCDKSCITGAKEQLTSLFEENNLYPSDINPMKTLEDIFSINNELKNGNIPKTNLPLDSHIIDYNTLFSLIEKVPFIMNRAKCNGEIPYLPIHPISYRKKWQYDDMPYNFIYDFLASFTDFKFKDELKEVLIQTRRKLIYEYTIEQLYNYLLLCGPDSIARRYQTKELKKSFEERMKTW